MAAVSGHRGITLGEVMHANLAAEVGASTPSTCRSAEFRSTFVRCITMCLPCMIPPSIRLTSHFVAHSLASRFGTSTLGRMRTTPLPHIFRPSRSCSPAATCSTPLYTVSYSIGLSLPVASRSTTSLTT
jgi:hypothetical protein